MKITPMRQGDIPEVLELMELGAPYVRARTASDYWLYATLFSSTCPLARHDGHVVGAIIAFRGQDTPTEVYLQDVIAHPDHRRTGITTALLDEVTASSRSLGVRRLWLTSEPENTAAHATWVRRGFTNVVGDHNVDGVSVTSNFKGPGKHRAIYELYL